MQNINNVVIAIAIAKDGESPKSFLMFTENMKTEKSSDWKIWDMFEILCTKNRYLVNGKGKHCKVLIADEKEKFPLVRLLKLRLEGSRDPETNVCNIDLKELFSY